MAEHGVSERMACRVLGQHRSTQRKIPTTPEDEAALTADIVALAIQYGRYGYRRVTAMLRSAGFTIETRAEDEVYICRRAEMPYAQWGAGPVYPQRG